MLSTPPFLAENGFVDGLLVNASCKCMAYASASKRMYHITTALGFPQQYIAHASHLLIIIHWSPL